MEQRHLIVVDEQRQTDALKRIGDSLRSEGIELISVEIDPSQYKKRLGNGDVIFDRDSLAEAINSVPFKTLSLFTSSISLKLFVVPLQI